MRKTIFYLLLLSLLMLTVEAHQTASAEPLKQSSQPVTPLIKALDQTIDQSQAQEQQLKQEVTGLQVEDSALQTRIDKVDQELNQLRNQQVQPVTLQTQTTPAPLSYNPIQIIEKAGPILDLRLAIGLIILALLLLVWLFWPRAVTSIEEAPKPHYEPQFVETDLKDEYDFMSSEEAVPVKLDLARAYIDMENFDGARDVLHEVMQRGDEGQRQEAQTLLSQLT